LTDSFADFLKLPDTTKFLPKPFKTKVVPLCSGKNHKSKANYDSKQSKKIKILSVIGRI